MSRKTCFIIFIAALVTIMVSFILNFTPVTAEVAKIFSAMQGIYLSVCAVVISLLLSKQRHYWLIMLGCAVVAAVLIELFVAGGTIMSLAVLYKIAAFIVYAYLVMLVRYML